jgi:hypothetical protein
MKDGKQPPWGSICALSEKKLSALTDHLKGLLDSREIVPSKSPTGAPILFIPPPHRRGISLCIVYRGLSHVMIMYRYPLQLMKQLRDRVAGTRISTKFYLRAGYNLIEIRPGDK